jgi:hypothetical protein
MARLLLALLLLLPLAAPVRAADSAVETQLRYLEKDLDRLREEVKALPETIKAAEKSAEESVKERLDAQDKRIGDLSLVLAEGANKIASSSNAISSASNTTSWVVGIGAILLTAGLFGVGLYSVLKVPEQARLAAEQIIKQYLDSPEAKKDFHNSFETLLGPEISAIQVLAKRGDHLPVGPSYPDTQTSVNPGDPGDRLTSSPSSQPLAPSPPETEQALLKVRSIPEEKRTTEQWSALIVSETENKSYNAALKLIETWLLQIGLSKIDVSHAMMLQAWVLDVSGRKDEAISIWSNIINRFSDDKALELRTQVSSAILSKGSALESLTPPQPNIAIEIYEELDKRFGKDTTPTIRKHVAISLINKAFAYRHLTPPQPETEIKIYEELDKRYGKEDALKEQVVTALFNKGRALGLLTPSRPLAEIAAYEELDRRFGGDKTLNDKVAIALLCKGLAFKRTNPPQLKAQIEAYEELDKRFSADKNPTVSQFIAFSLVEKGIAFGKLYPSHPKDEIAIYESVKDRFIHDLSVEVQTQVARSLIEKSRVEYAKIKNKYLAQTTLNKYLDFFDKNADTTIQNLTKMVHTRLAELNAPYSGQNSSDT